jgi:hypothetical protein
MKLKSLSHLVENNSMAGGYCDIYNSVEFLVYVKTVSALWNDLNSKISENTRIRIVLGVRNEA